MRAQIVALGRDKAKRLLATGPVEDAATGIDPFSLALLDGSTAARAYWMPGDRPQSAVVY